MTVLNAGTVEHILDVAQALRNIHALTRTGGVMIHVAPISWFEHGYYSFNPRIFEELGRANQYVTLVEAFHFGRDVLASKDIDSKLYVTFDGYKFNPLREKVWAVLKADSAPSNVLYMIAQRKQVEREFMVPLDVQS